MTPSTAGRPSRVEGTERRILAAARELFIAQGYQDTTLSAVAERAGVGARTVYLRFGSKGTVLLRAAGVGSAEPATGVALAEPAAGVALAEPAAGVAGRAAGVVSGEPAIGVALAEPAAGVAVRAAGVGSAEPAADREPSDPLAAFARLARTRYERLGGLVRVLAQAAATEPFVADALAQARATNRTAAADLVAALRTAGRLSPGVDPVQASETVAVLCAGEAWLALSESAGWDADRYERWLADTIRRVLRG